MFMSTHPSIIGKASNFFTWAFCLTPPKTFFQDFNFLSVPFPRPLLFIPPPPAGHAHRGEDQHVRLPAHGVAPPQPVGRPPHGSAQRPPALPPFESLRPPRPEPTTARGGGLCGEGGTPGVKVGTRGKWWQGGPTGRGGPSGWVGAPPSPWSFKTPLGQWVGGVPCGPSSTDRRNDMRALVVAHRGHCYDGRDLRRTLEVYAPPRCNQPAHCFLLRPPSCPMAPPNFWLVLSQNVILSKSLPH